MANPAPYIIWFEDARGADTKEVGGKFANLVRLHSIGARVPRGFAVSTSAYREFMSGLVNQVSSILATVDPGDLATAESASRRVGEIIRGTPVPAELAGAIRSAYSTLAKSESSERDDLPVAVRSSATAEDMQNASVAGQHETFLWIKGAERVVEYVRECWASAFAARSISYHRTKKIDESGVEMGVVVQKMVESRKSGVMFTLNPSNGDPSKISIDSTWGLGEAVVSGVVTPDLYVVDKVTLEILTRRIGRKHIEFVVAGNEVKEVAVSQERQQTPSLSDKEILALARVGKSVEKAFGIPQDIEWALDGSPDPYLGLYVLQARPETVWSSRSGPKMDSEDSVDRVIETLKRGQKLQ